MVFNADMSLSIILVLVLKAPLVVSLIYIPSDGSLLSSSDCNTLKILIIFLFEVFVLSTPSISAGRIMSSLFSFERSKFSTMIKLPTLKVINESFVSYVNLPFSSVVPICPPSVS